jgi:formylmethanofuran dehydrogenase subunit E
MTDDPLFDFHRRDQEEIEWLNSLPKCSECGEPIQDDCHYNIHGKIYCQRCLDYEFKVLTHNEY